MIGLLVPLIVLLLVAVWLVVLALTDADLPTVVPGWARRSAGRLVESEREFASGLGWRQGRWFLLRGLILLAGLVLGVMSGVPVLIALDSLLGATVLRFVLSAVTERRRVLQARAFLTFMTAIGDRLGARGLELAAVVRTAAAQVPHEVDVLLAPVAAAGADVFGVLVRQVERARSAPLERCCAVLLSNRDRDLGMVARLISEEVATLETELDAEDLRVAARAESRWTVLAMGAVVLAFAALLNQVPSLHAVFLTGRGQLGLITSMAIFAVTATVMGFLLRAPGMSRWDLRRMHHDLIGAGVGGGTDE